MERNLFRYGAVCGIAGTVLGFVFNAIHPRNLDYNHITLSTLQEVSASRIWVGDHLTLILAAVLSILGFAALSRSMTSPKGGALARLAFVAALVGGGVLLVTIALDGIATKTIADTWAASSGILKSEAFTAGAVVVASNIALLAISIILFFGITFALFGLAVAVDGAYPKGLGWIALLAGAASVIDGGWIAYKGLSANNVVLFVASTLLATLWVFVMFILLWKKGSQAAA
jgi:hypothetical protein